MRFLSFAFLSLVLVACRTDALDSGHANPDAGPLPPTTVACGDLADAASCGARSDCESSGCADCSGQVVFQHCIDAGSTGTPFCPVLKCESTCDQIHDEGSCSADPACVAVYADPGTCDCDTPGCCMAFTRCTDGPAQCSPSAAGNGPSCEPLPYDCGPSYNPIFDEQCEVGCVKLDICNDDCRTQGCDTGTQCVYCWTSYECIPDNAAC